VTITGAPGAGENVAEALVAGDSKAEGASEGFEEGLDLMMRGTPIEHAKVDVGTGSLRKTLKEIFHEFGLEAAHRSRGEFRFNDTKGATAKIDGGGSKGFIHGHEEIAGAQNAALVAKGGVDAFTESDAHIFNSVMLVDIQVTDGSQLQVKSAVTGDQIEHVIEEGDAGGDRGFTAAIQIQP
jgi:hypothetical protein